MLTLEELEHKEAVLREEFKRKLHKLDVEGTNDMYDIKCVKTYGILWHVAHQLLMAEQKQSNQRSTTADTMNIQTTGLKMIGGK